MKDSAHNAEIRILSMQRTVNFGSVLQAYSLRALLEEVSGQAVGFLDIDDAEVLPSVRELMESVDYEDPAAYPPGLLQKVKRRCITYLSAWNKRKIRRFMKRTLGLKRNNYPERSKLTVIGSDEVFNHSRGINLQLHGKVQGTDRIVTYGASCGTAVVRDIPYESLGQVRESMGHISLMSVRDAATERYISELWQGEAFRHLDPVLVGCLPKRKHRRVPLKNYLLVYAYGQRIRTDEEISAIREYARARGLKIVAMGGSQFWCDLYIPASPFRLMDYFYGAECVVTDTFHGVVFSVINRRRFAVISRRTNREKISSLLEDLGLTNRLLQGMDALESAMDEQMDYGRVDAIIRKERKRTREYLLKCLEACQ